MNSKILLVTAAVMLATIAQSTNVYGALYPLPGNPLTEGSSTSPAPGGLSGLLNALIDAIISILFGVVNQPTPKPTNLITLLQGVLNDLFTLIQDLLS